MKGVFTPMAGWARRTNKGFYREHSSFGSSLSLNFINDNYSLGAVGSQKGTKAFSDIITFTRASGGGRFNASGVYEWLGNDVPRLDYDPVTLQPRGILIEEQRTNLLTYSEQFDSPVWAKNAGVVVQPGAALAPDGTASAAKISGMQAAAGDRITRTVATSSPITATSSVWVRADSGDVGKTVIFSIRRDTGTVAETQVVVTLTGVWQRVQATLTMLPDNSGLRFIFVRGTADSFYSWGAQLEAGAFPTSYIPTVASQVTRSADVASVNTLSPWYNASEGTLFVEYSRKWGSSPQQGRVAYLSGPDTNNTIQIRAGGSGAALGTIADGGVINADIQSPTLPAAKAKAAFSWSAAGASLSANGSFVGEDSSVVIPQGLTTLWLGNSFGNTQLRGHIQSLEYYPRRLSNTELQEITA